VNLKVGKTLGLIVDEGTPSRALNQIERREREMQEGKF